MKLRSTVTLLIWNVETKKKITKCIETIFHSKAKNLTYVIPVTFSTLLLSTASMRHDTVVPQCAFKKVTICEAWSHMVKRNIETSHTDVNTANFKIIDMNFSNNKRKRKIAESLWIKDLRPTLNVQEKPIPLKLFN